MDWVVNATGDDRNLGKASFILVITGVLNRTRTKYGNRGYRYILLDAGHLAQNILLMITSLNLAGYPIGGFIDNEFNKLLDIDKRKEVALYLVAVGQNSK
ncbi:MAG: SagB/ThcOx family dehydrogenase [Actinobacteria bacterium]|nr:SagB/ThcOx family dehydrogenase [Actinomycetota bacterium]